ncbi:unnamed protein product [Schistocephalus solidus]|uniref:Uncharacterized protein n=1 Tax=Schistocephalus solidus TaxID=70667 RepID=A0A183ST48_SCHSO|nr:unnamed protein product [Schistocephalus solidus]
MPDLPSGPMLLDDDEGVPRYLLLPRSSLAVFHNGYVRSTEVPDNVVLIGGRPYPRQLTSTSEDEEEFIRRSKEPEGKLAGWPMPPLIFQPLSEPVSCLMWEGAHWLTGWRTRLRAPQQELAPITHTPGFTYSGDMEEPSPSDSQSTGQSLDTRHIHWADGVVWCKRQIGSLPTPGF